MGSDERSFWRFAQILKFKDNRFWWRWRQLPLWARWLSWILLGSGSPRTTLVVHPWYTEHHYKQGSAIRSVLLFWYWGWSSTKGIIASATSWTACKIELCLFGLNYPWKRWLEGVICRHRLCINSGTVVFSCFEKQLEIRAFKRIKRDY